MKSAQGIFQHHFQYKKVCTILNKIQYFFEAAENTLAYYYTATTNVVKSFRVHAPD